MASTLRGLVLVGLLAGLAACGDSGSVPVADPPDPPDQLDQLGPSAVGHSAFVAVDAGRDDRALPVDVWYPVDAEDVGDTPFATYPLAPGIGLESDVALDSPPVSRRQGQSLLVFSHGYQSINTQSVELMEALASHGFVVVSPEHVGNSQSDPSDSFDEAAAKRVPDVSFLIDTMIARNRDPEDEFFDRLDEERFGVVGHSFGAMTAVGMAAGWAGAEPDPRVVAIAPISAVFDGDLQRDERTGPNAGFTAERLARIVVPAMLVGGTEDTNVFIENNAVAFEQMTNAPRVYKVDVIGANHTHFANICTIGNLLIGLGIGPELWPAIGAEDLIEPYEATCTPDAFPIEEALRLQSLYTVSFFRRHLRDEIEYGRFLTPAFAETEPAVRISVR